MQATLVCLADAGLIPTTELASGVLITRITVDRQSLDIVAAEAAVARCRQESSLDAIEQALSLQMRTASVTQQATPRVLIEACLDQLGNPGRGADELAGCFTGTTATTGIPPLALVEQ